MKIKNEILKSGLLSLLLITMSCETTELEITSNPNFLSPEQANADFFLNSIQVDFAFIIQKFGNDAAELTRIDYMFGRNYENAYTPNELVNSPRRDMSPWRLAYQRILEDLRLMNILAIEAEQYNHIAIGQVLQSYLLTTLVDMYGDIPYSEALQGADNLNPSVDPGSNVYEAALQLLNDAISNFERASGSNPQNDFFYNGNYENWIKAANSLKMKIYLTTRLVDTNSINSFNSIVASGNYIKEVSEDFQFQWGTNEVQPDTRHPWYEDNYTSTGGGRYMSNWLMNTMLNSPGGKDPRMVYYFYRQVSAAPGFGTPPDEETLECGLQNPPSHYSGEVFCSVTDGYWGRDHGNDNGIPPDGFLRTLNGVYPAGGRFDDASFEGTTNGGGNGGNGITPLMLASWIDFMIAEKQLLDQDISGARGSLEAGMTKSFEKVESFIDHPSEPNATVVENHRNTILTSYDNANNEEDRWNAVFEQYWIALYGNGIDAYNAYRRTGYPTSLQPNIEPNPGVFVRSLPYPANFVETNSNVSQKSTVGVKVFWDTNPDSPSFPSAN
jgi:hypothetical protein